MKPCIISRPLCCWWRCVLLMATWTPHIQLVYKLIYGWLWSHVRNFLVASPFSRRMSRVQITRMFAVDCMTCFLRLKRVFYPTQRTQRNKRNWRNGHNNCFSYVVYLVYPWVLAIASAALLLTFLAFHACHESRPNIFFAFAAYRLRCVRCI